MKKVAFLIISLIIIFLITGCAIFNLPFFGGGGETDLADYCKISFLDPNTKEPFSSPITFPASVVIKYQYNGYYPVEDLKMDVVQVINDRNWLSVENLNPTSAMVNFVNEESAGDFLVQTEMRTINKDTVSASKLLHIVDPSPATITEFEFYLTENSTLIPNYQNDAFLWMKIKDDESMLFSKSILASFVSKSKLYINGRDMSTSGFPPESAIVSDDGKQIICIAKLNIPEMNQVFQTPIILEGENKFRFVFEGFNSDGSGFIEKDLMLTAAYTDNTPPEIIDYDYVDAGPGIGYMDFSVTDEFSLYLEVKDKGDMFDTFDPSGLASLTWRISGENQTPISDTIDLTYLAKDALYQEYIPIRIRSYDYPSGIYRLLITIEDRKGNTTTFGPKTFNYNVTSWKEADIKVEKIAGDMGALYTYFAGETLRFSIDSDLTYDSENWSIIPDVGTDFTTNANNNTMIGGAVYRNIKYGDYVVYVEAKKDGIPYYGETSFSVEPSQTYVNQPVITYNVESPSEPSKLFEVVVDSLIDLPSDPYETLKKKKLVYTKDGHPEPAKVDLFPFEYSDSKQQTFKAMVLTSSGSPIILDNYDRVELILTAEDIRGNVSEKPFFFSNE
jgi:hypothetical protein